MEGQALYRTQLKTLIWKNFLLKRRNVAFLVVEFLCPLILFTIIVLVRTDQPAVKNPACHFQQKALPSAGYLPFLHSFMCSLENNCFGYPPETIDSRSPLKDLISSVANIISSDDFQKLAALLKPSKKLAKKLDEKGVTRLLTPGGMFDQKELAKLSPRTRDALNQSTLNLGKFARQMDTATMTSFFASYLANGKPSLCRNGTMSEIIQLPDESKRNEVSNEFCNLSLDRQRALLKPTNEVLDNIASDDEFVHDTVEFYRESGKPGMKDAYNNTFARIANFGQLLAQINLKRAPGSISTGNFRDSPFSQFVCGWLSLLWTKERSLMNEDAAKDAVSNMEETEYEYDPEYTPECNALFKNMSTCSDKLESLARQNAWKMIKPLAVGKLFFTPMNNATLRIIKEFNKTFEHVDTIKRLVNSLMQARNEMFQQLYEFMSDPLHPKKPKDRVFMDLLSQSMGEKLHNQSEATKLFFSNAVPQPGQVTWQNTFNQTFDYLKSANIYIQCFSTQRFVGFNTEKEMEEQSFVLLDKFKVWAGFVFNSTQISPNVIPPLMIYKIRMKSGDVDDTLKLKDEVWRAQPRKKLIPPGGDLKPILSGQLYLMDLLEKAIIALQVNASVPNQTVYRDGQRFYPPQRTGTWIKQFPTHCYVKDELVKNLRDLLPFLMVLAWVASVAILVKSIVYEKETRLKEVMRIMGLKNSAHWLSSFVVAVTILFTAAVMLAFLMKYGTIFTNSDLSLIIFLFFVYLLPTIFFCFLMSTFFSNANLAAAVAAIVFFITFMPYVTYWAFKEQMNSVAVKMALSILSNVAFGFVCSYIIDYEMQGTGVQWDNIAQSPNYGDPFCLGYALIMLFFDAILYLVLTLYIEQVLPGKYGVPRKWYYLCQTSTYKKMQIDTDDASFDPNFKLQGENFEEEPDDLPIGVQVRELWKIYGTGKKVAVKGLNLNFYESQITSFLGHNGAGKTTTMSIICGMFPPSKGTVFINGRDVRKCQESIRKNIGMCPQYNVLFDKLTVLEHLRFYGRLRGKSPVEIEKFAIALLFDLSLTHKASDYSMNLSGGMKRKLSVAISFIGDNKTVILDEPTAGVDPHSRRGIWELLSKYKEGRTIILSTHFMDEADVLGDRIAIISDGQLQCAGSSLFLRRKFGDGYQLVLVRDPDVDIRDIDTEPSSKSVVRSDNTVEKSYYSNKGSGSDSRQIRIMNLTSEKAAEKLSNFVMKHFPEAEMVKSVGIEIAFMLPYSGLSSGKFLTLLSELERNKKKLGITDYGLADTTLEDIFIKVADMQPDEGEVFYEKRWFFFCLCGCFCCCRCAKRAFYQKIEAEPEQQTIMVKDRDRSKSVMAIGMREKKSVKDTPTSRFHDEDDEDESDDVELGPDTRATFRKASRPLAVVFAQKNTPKVAGTRLKTQQFNALLVKRWHHVRRDQRAFFSQIMLPALFILIAMLFASILPSAVDQMSMEIHIYYYGDGNYMFFSNSAPGDQNASTLSLGLQNTIHHGTRCIAGYKIRDMKDRKKVYECKFSAQKHYNEPKNPDFLKLYDPHSWWPSPPCNCTDGFPECQPMAGGPVPRRKILATTEKLQDLTNRNISDYLMKTRYDYKMRRLYGYEFQGVRDDFNIDGPGFWRSSKMIEDFFDNNTFLNKNYSSGFSWHRVISDLNSLVNSTIVENNVLIWWNNKAHHGLIASVNALNNLLLRESLPPNLPNRDSYGIVAYSHPWKKTSAQLSKEFMRKLIKDIIVALFIIFALGFIPASFVLFLIEEKATKSKHLQYVSGVIPTIYWFSAFLWDFINFILSLIVVIAIFLIFQQDAYVSGDNFPCLVVLLLLYGWAVTPLMYPFSFVFKVPSTAYVLLILINGFVGIITTLTTFMFELLGRMQKVAQALNVVFLVFPQFCLGRGLFTMAKNQMQSDLLGGFGEYQKPSPFEFSEVGKYLLALTIQGFVFFIILLGIEHHYVIRRSQVLRKRRKMQRQAETKSRHSRSHIPQDFLDDDAYSLKSVETDVRSEQQRVLRGELDEQPVVVKQLRKEYKTTKGKFTAVKSLTFHVPSNSCFGLLGINGAGKTTTFTMLTGDVLPSGGQAIVGGYDVVTHVNESRKKLGFCPQFDAINALLSVKEHIMLYARLRGIEQKDIPFVTESIISKMGLIKYIQRQAGTLSGGNKRKLSTAIALVGDPQIIFLDEPTAGMDPKARRFLWQSIHDAVSEGRSVVLTSHSMEECEALCTRLAIMVNGQFKCMGSTQHIKTKYGSGYVVHVKVKPGIGDTVERFFLTKFPESEVKERLPGLIVFQVPQDHAAVVSLFEMMERAKKMKVKFDFMTPDTLVDDYSISQTTLDQVFINFAGEQSDDPLRAMKSQQALTKLYSRSFSRAVLNRATSRGQIILDAPDDSRQARRASTIGEVEESEGQQTDAGKVPSVRAESEDRDTAGGGSEREVTGRGLSGDDSNLEGKPDKSGKGGTLMPAPTTVADPSEARSSARTSVSKRKTQQFWRPFMAPPVSSENRKSMGKSWDGSQVKKEIRDSITRGGSLKPPELRSDQRSLISDETRDGRRSRSRDGRRREPRDTRLSEPRERRTRHSRDGRGSEPREGRKSTEPRESRANYPRESRTSEPPREKRASTDPRGQRLNAIRGGSFEDLREKRTSSEPRETRASEPREGRRSKTREGRRSEPREERRSEPRETRVSEPRETRVSEPRESRTERRREGRRSERREGRRSEPRETRTSEPRERRSEPREGRRSEPREGRRSEPREGRRSEPREERRSEPKETRASEPREGRSSKTREERRSEPREERRSEPRETRVSEPRETRVGEPREERRSEPRETRLSEPREARDERTSRSREGRPSGDRKDTRRSETKETRGSGSRGEEEADKTREEEKSGIKEEVSKIPEESGISGDSREKRDEGKSPPRDSESKERGERGYFTGLRDSEPKEKKKKVRRRRTDPM